MRHADGHFTGAEGVELYYQSWLPEHDPRGVLAIVHGVGEHCGRYMNLVDPLVAAGYAVYGFDQRGHGRSQGKRVHIKRWDEYRDDVTSYVALIAEQMSSVPLVIYGHSMGSLVVLDYLLQQPTGLTGAVISGTATEPAGIASPALVTAAKVLTNVVPGLYLDLGIDPASLTRDPEALDAYARDTDVYSRATVRWGTESLKTVNRVKEGMGAIRLPLLVLHGGADPLNMPAGASELFETVSSEDKTLKFYPDVCHEPHNDLGHERVAQDIKDWMDHLTPDPGTGVHS